MYCGQHGSLTFPVKYHLVAKPAQAPLISADKIFPELLLIGAKSEYSYSVKFGTQLGGTYDK